MEKLHFEEKWYLSWKFMKYFITYMIQSVFPPDEYFLFILTFIFTDSSACFLGRVSILFRSDVSSWQVGHRGWRTDKIFVDRSPRTKTYLILSMFFDHHQSGFESKSVRFHKWDPHEIQKRLKRFKLINKL